LKEQLLKLLAKMALRLIKLQELSAFEELQRKITALSTKSLGKLSKIMLMESMPILQAMPMFCRWNLQSGGFLIQRLGHL
jgi:hypothetical protein